jgi:hypothetical protein
MKNMERAIGITEKRPAKKYFLNIAAILFTTLPRGLFRPFLYSISKFPWRRENNRDNNAAVGYRNVREAPGVTMGMCVSCESKVLGKEPKIPR